MLFKRRLDLHFSLQKSLVILFVGVLLIGIGVIVGGSPPMYETTEQVNETNYQTSLVHNSTTVASNSSLYDDGEVLENRQIYYQQLHPILRVSPETTQSVEESDVTVRMYATRNRQSNVIWERQVGFEERTVEYNNSSGIVTLPTPVIKQSMEVIEQELPQGSSMWYEVTYDATYTYAGEQVSQTAILTVQFGTPETYQVTTSESQTVKSQQQSNSQPIPAQTITLFATPIYIYGIAIGLLGLVFVGFGAYLLYGYKFDPREYSERLYQYHLEKYTDWITFGRPMTDPQLRGSSDNKVLVNTLEGLVQISIDSDSRVVYSEDLKQFYIFGTNSVYFFKPPNSVSPLEITNNIPEVPDQSNTPTAQSGSLLNSSDQNKSNDEEKPRNTAEATGDAEESDTTQTSENNSSEDEKRDSESESEDMDGDGSLGSDMFGDMDDEF